MIYLDNAATTFPKPECVYATVDSVQRNTAVNVGRGSYRIATEAMKTVDETRYLLAQLTGARSSVNVIFTASATIAANEIIFGLEWDAYKNVYISPFEHNAVARPIEMVRKQFGFSVFQLPFDGDTHALDIQKMQRMFASAPPDYVFVNHISNVTGTVLPVEVIGSASKQYDAVVIVDGAQSIGLVDVDLSIMPVDYLIFAGHKNLYSSWGIGGFIVNCAKPLKPHLSGGTGSDSLNLNMNSLAPEGFEVGSPNIIAISSLNASLRWLSDIGIASISDRKEALMKRLITGLDNMPVKLYLPADMHQHTSVLSLNLSDYRPDEIGTILSQDFDIAVRTGYHCAPYIHDLIGTKERRGTIRVSMSYFNSEYDIDALLSAISEI